MMSHSRHQEMLKSVPANAQKVYDIIPIATGWSYSQIHQEMQRIGHNMRQEVLMGCVVRLKDAGLVYEPIPNTFQRTPHKQKPELRAPITFTTEKEELNANKTLTMNKPSVNAQESSTDRLGKLAERMRKLGDVANMVVKEAQTIADELDDVALAVEEQITTGGEELQKLRTLSAALKALA